MIEQIGNHNGFTHVLSAPGFLKAVDWRRRRGTVDARYTGGNLPKSEISVNDAVLYSAIGGNW